jgi:hypothetical protein
MYRSSCQALFRCDKIHTFVCSIAQPPASNAQHRLVFHLLLKMIWLARLSHNAVTSLLLNMILPSAAVLEKQISVQEIFFQMNSRTLYSLWIIKQPCKEIIFKHIKAKVSIYQASTSIAATASSAATTTRRTVEQTKRQANRDIRACRQTPAACDSARPSA